MEVQKLLSHQIYVHLFKRVALSSERRGEKGRAVCLVMNDDETGTDGRGDVVDGIVRKLHDRIA